MFSTFFRFETRYWRRSMMLYVFVFVLGLLVFAACSSDNVVLGSSLDNTDRNAPYVIQTFYGVMAILTTLMVAAFVNPAASRDFIYDTHQIIFTKPIKKLPFLLGRFWGATLIAVIPMLGISLGVILAGFMPWIEQEYWGPIAWRAHLASFFTFAIPNTILVAATIFAIAVWTRSSVASFIGAILLIVGYSVAQNMVGNLDNENLSIMSDPFGLQAFSTITKYWTVSDKNTQFVGLSGVWRVMGRKSRVCPSGPDDDRQPSPVAGNWDGNPGGRVRAIFLCRTQSPIQTRNAGNPCVRCRRGGPQSELSPWLGVPACTACQPDQSRLLGNDQEQRLSSS